MFTEDTSCTIAKLKQGKETNVHLEKAGLRHFSFTLYSFSPSLSKGFILLISDDMSFTCEAAPCLSAPNSWQGSFVGTDNFTILCTLHF